MVSKVDEPEVTVDTMAEVVTAELLPPLTPAPPAAPKIVVDPTVEVMVEPSETMVETMAEVVMATEEP